MKQGSHKSNPNGHAPSWWSTHATGPIIYIPYIGPMQLQRCLPSRSPRLGLGATRSVKRLEAEQEFRDKLYSSVPNITYFNLLRNSRYEKRHP